MPQKKSDFVKRFRKIWKSIVQPKILFAKETYHLAFYNRKGQIEWRISRTLWANAILKDVASAFGDKWPDFTALPKEFGHKYAVVIVPPDLFGSSYILYKTKVKN